ncbi:MAG: phospho-N-acetylmuramoyl-pentapeptide-transferase [Clostridiales Family XIII bacterium]|jgi:phospho-N-acetylmuramoyl-pentapeptide-transferase|nr:phospho-N-acetylmuramoyl-pentapeptide-transferase [Clostridiales Family XIII bacterium]
MHIEIKLFDIMLPFLTACIVSTLVTMWLIPYLKRIKAAQQIYEDAPETHKKKSGTPTMGGIGIICGIFAGCIVSLVVQGFSISMLVVLAVVAIFGFVGFLDDYTKIMKKRNLGLTPKQKLVLQAVVAVVVAIYYIWGAGFGTRILIPFIWKSVDISYFMIPYIVFVILAMVNSVNLTDGLDGLASGVTSVLGLFFPAITMLGLNLSGKAIAAGYLPNILVNVHSDMLYFSAMAGACIGFLIWNRHPAKIFMGDTGSLALGGGIAVAALFTHMELLLVLVGFVYVAEALSDIIQVTYFKKTGGKRIFKMAPLHHHFELSGWDETKVVTVFTTVTLVISVAVVIILSIQTILQ